MRNHKYGVYASVGRGKGRRIEQIEYNLLLDLNKFGLDKSVRDNISSVKIKVDDKSVTYRIHPIYVTVYGDRYLYIEVFKESYCLSRDMMESTYDAILNKTIAAEILLKDGNIIELESKNYDDVSEVELTRLQFEIFDV